MNNNLLTKDDLLSIYGSVKKKSDKRYGLFTGNFHLVAVFDNLPDARAIVRQLKRANEVHIYRIDDEDNKIGKELKKL